MRSTVVLLVLVMFFVSACTAGGGRRRGLTAPSTGDATTLDVVDNGTDRGGVVFDPGTRDVIDEPDVPAIEDVPTVEELPPPVDEGPPPEPDEGPPPPTETLSGGVLIVEIDNADPPVHVSTVTTKFRNGPAPLANASETIGECQIIWSDGTPVPDPSRGLDAGTVSVSGITPPLTMAPTMHETQGAIYTSGLSEDHADVFGGAPTIAVEVGGGTEVAPFGAQVPTPAAVNVFSPQADGTIDKDNALQVTWNPANGTHVRIDLFVFDGADEEQKKGNTIACELSGDTGSYVIPAQVMGKLPGGGKSGFPDFNFDYVVFGVSRITLTEVPVDGWLGGASLAATRTSGGIAKLHD